MNTGLDEVLETSTNFKSDPLENNGVYPQSSRFLIKFDESEISNIFSTLIGTSSWDANLKCFIAESTGLSNNTTLAINALYENRGS